jgi:DNA-binding CsgD family transcriptional regulator
LWVAGYLGLSQRDPKSAVPMLEEAMRLGAEYDGTAFAYASQFLGRGLWLLGDCDRGLRLTEQALTSHRTAKSWQGIVLALVQLGWMKTLSDTPAGNREILQECVDVCTLHGERWICSYALWSLGLAALLDGRLDEATRLETKALRLKQRVLDQAGAPLCVEALAWIAGAQHRAQRAAVLLGAAAAAWQSLPGFLPHSLQELHAGCRDGAERALGSGRFEAAFASGERMTTDEAVAVACDEHRDEPPRPSPRSPGNSPVKLTRREQEIAVLLSEGMSNADIGRTLTVSSRTAETHVRHIMDKLGFSSRAQIAGWAAAGRGAGERSEPRPAST